MSKFTNLIVEGREIDKIEFYFNNKQFYPILLAKNKKDLQKAIDDFHLHHAENLSPLLKLLNVKEEHIIKFLPLLFDNK